jgi:quinoprotein glucose dehydrogenase
LAGIAADPAVAEELRREALDALVQWKTPPGRDRVLGTWRPAVGGRASDAGAEAVAPVLLPLLKSGPDLLRLAAAEGAGALGISSAEPDLVTLAADSEAGGKSRAAALHALELLESPKLEAAVEAALGAKDSVLLAEARRLLVKLFPERAALAADRLGSGHVPAALELDLLEAAGRHIDPAVQQKLAAFETTRKAGDPIARWRECLEGGDAKAGRQIFLEKAEAACVRCHKIAGVGGDVGPDLAHVGSKYDRVYLLTSVVLPNAAIAPGFESVAITLKNGVIVAGLLSSENQDELTITPLGGGEKTVVKKSEIAERTTAPSPMPEGLGEVLGKRGLRDVVEFLSSLK